MDAKAEKSPAEMTAEFLETHGDIEYADLLISDLNSIIRGKSAPPKSLVKAANPGMNLPLSIFGLDIWGREVASTNLHIETGDKDGFCRLIPGRVSLIPWSEQPAAQALLSMYCEDGTPYAADPRHALQGVVDRLAEKGLRAVTAMELEFYLVEEESYLRKGQMSENATFGPDQQEMYALSALGGRDGLFEAIRSAAKAQGLPVDTIIKEAAPGQYEVNLYHRDDPLAAADDAVLLRRLIGGLARQAGFRATFMPKPFGHWPGNGLHVHASLLDKQGNNIFAGDDGRKRLAQAAAGLLQTMRDCQLVFIPSFNGFRRLTPGSYAPTALAWGWNNRSVAVRVPASDEAALRLEHRLSGADANPYLVMAAVLGGMLHGMEQKLEAPEPSEGNAYDANLPSLTDEMDEAIDAFARSDFAKETFGELLHHVFTEVKRAEILEFWNEITPLERSTYL